MAIADQLLELMFSWIKQRECCAEQLRTLAQELESLRKKCNAAECVGSTYAVVGALSLIGAGAATLFTGGAAAPLLGVAGAAFSGAGLTVSVASKIIEHFSSSDTMEEAQKIEKKSKEVAEKIQDLFERLKAESSSTDSDKVDQHVMTEILKAMTRRSGLEGQVDFSGTFFQAYRGLNQIFFNPAMIDGLEVGLAGILRFFTYRVSGKIYKPLFLEGAEQLTKQMTIMAAKGGKSLTKEMSKIGFKTAFKGGAMVVGGVVGLAFELPEAIDNWKDLIKKNHVTEASQSLRDTAKAIEKICQTLREQFDNMKRVFKEMAKRQQELEERERAKRQREFEERERAKRQRELEERERAKRQRELEERERAKRQREFEERERAKRQRELEERERAKRQQELEERERAKRQREFEERERAKRQRELEERERAKRQRELEERERAKRQRELEERERAKRQRELEERERAKRQRELEERERAKRQRELEERERAKRQRELEERERAKRQRELEERERAKRQRELEEREQAKCLKEIIRLLEEMDTSQQEHEETAQAWPLVAPSTGRSSSVSTMASILKMDKTQGEDKRNLSRGKNIRSCKQKSESLNKYQFISSNLAQDKSGHQQTSAKSQTHQRHKDRRKGDQTEQTGSGQERDSHQNEETGSGQQGGGGQGDKESSGEDEESDQEDEETDSEEETEEDERKQTGRKRTKRHQKKGTQSKQRGDNEEVVRQCQDSWIDQDQRTIQTPPGIIRVGLLNVRSMNNRRSRILELITQNNLDVFLTTETWLQKYNADTVLREASPQNYHYHYQLRVGQRGGGVANQFRQELQGENNPFDSLTTFECVVTVLHHDEWNQPVPIINVYHPPGYNRDQFRTFLDEFETLLAFFSNYNSIIVTGDFNIWVDQERRSFTDEFYHIWPIYNLEQHVQEPTHRAGHTLDLVLTRNVEISHLVVQNDGISDHFTVYFNAKPKDKRKKTKKKKN